MQLSQLHEAIDYGFFETSQGEHLPKQIKRAIFKRLDAATSFSLVEPELGSSWQDHTSTSLEAQQLELEAVLEGLGSECLPLDDLAAQHAQQAAGGGFKSFAELQALAPGFFQIPQPLLEEDEAQVSTTYVAD
jgi:hypothetical protein